jgi:hypothetical protein
MYIATGQGRLPADLPEFQARRTILHCGIALAELAVSACILDPVHQRAKAIHDAYVTFSESLIWPAIKPILRAKIVIVTDHIRISPGIPMTVDFVV